MRTGIGVAFLVAAAGVMPVRPQEADWVPAPPEMSHLMLAPPSPRDQPESTALQVFSTKLGADLGAKSIIGPAASGVSVVNAASLDPAVSPGSWVAIRGIDLAGVTRTWSGSDFNGDTLPTALSGTSVRIGTRNAAVYYVSPTQINALIPTDVPSGPATITVNSPVGGPASVNVTLEPFAPALFRFSPDSSRYAAAVFPDGSYAGRPGLFASNPGLTRAIRAGQRVALYATGLGTTNPPLQPGVNFTGPRPMNGAEFFKVRVGGQAAQVEFVGAISPGLYQINIVTPGLASGEHPVELEYGSAKSGSAAFLTIQGDPAQSRLSVNPGTVAMTASAGATAPAARALQLLSTGENFAFTVTSSAPWLTVSSNSNRTPAEVRVSADVRGLALGTYNERITVSAPESASPVTTIPITISVINTPQVTISRTSINRQLVTGFQSVDVLVNVTSDGLPVPFTIVSQAGTWLSAPESGITPEAVRVSFNSESLPPGSYTGNLRIVPERGEARNIAVSMTVFAAATPGGPMRALALEEDEVLLGREGEISVFGQSLDSVSGASILPSQGVTIDKVQARGPSRVAMEIKVDRTAAEGLRTLTVSGPGGTSSSIPIRIRRGQPQIGGLSPVVVNPGRFYASAGFSGSAKSNLFQIGGVDLQGIKEILVNPPDGIDASWSTSFANVSKIYGVMLVDRSARPGVRQLSITTASGTSNELAVEVRAAPAEAPAISNVTINSTSAVAGTIRYSGKLDFTDSNGDLAGGKLILMAYNGTGGTWQWLVVDDGAYLNQRGNKSGTITFSFERQFVFFGRELTGSIPVLCMIQDAAGNLSNMALSTVSVWQIAIF